MISDIMNTIQALENDINLEIDFANNFTTKRKLVQSVQKNTVFCGSGDSLCAAMLAEAFSDFTIHALDPLDVIKNKNLIKNKNAYFVSVSGNTISNIIAARHGKSTITITKNPGSNLAKTCNNTISLDYQDSKMLTSGSVGFLASVLTCISLVHDFEIKNAKSIFSKAKAQSKITPHNKIYFLGNQYTFPLAMYAAAKFGEILGLDAHYERLEQFSHMGLFSARKNDTVIIFEQKNAHNTKLKSNLKKIGLAVYNPSIDSKNKIDQILFYTFVSQLMPLYVAKKKKIKDCYFITQKKIRAASSDMIY